MMAAKKQKPPFIAGMSLLLFALTLVACGPGSYQLSSPDRGIETTVPDRRGETEFLWNPSLSRDAIPPIYDPEFVFASEAGYEDDELVMGVAIDGQAKAYPVGPLNSREMVNDVLAGTPILVTW